MKIKKIRGFIAPFVALSLLVESARGNNEWGIPIDVERLMEVGVRLAQDYEWDDRLIPVEWRGLWAGIEQSLQSYELLDLAWVRPEAEALLRVLQASPTGEPYASWLIQRMDYLDMANQVLRSYFNQPGPIRPPVVPGEATGRATRPPPHLRIPAEAKPDVQKVARNPINWDRKLASRARPTRAEQYLPSLKSIFEEEGVPPELVWLAEVESSFNPNARSPVGAVGLFQFMPATAEQYGLKVSPVDERINPEKSARAASRYLRYLHGKFNSWPLALASYNAGEGRVGRLLRTHQATTFEEIVDHLPAETQMYVPKVLATIRLREGTELASQR